MAKAATIGKPAGQTNFSGILDAAPTEVERPKPYPIGTYLFIVSGMPRYDKSSQKQTEFTEFTLKFMQPGEDVDQEELENVLKGEVLTEKSLKATFYHTENSIWRLDDFHEKCGLELDSEVSRRRRNEACVGCQIWGSVGHEPSKDGQSVFAKLTGFAKVE